MLRSSRSLVAGILVFGSTRCLAAQTTLEAQLAAEVQTAVASVSAAPRLLEWQVSHPGERTDPAHYDSSRDSYELDRQGTWCATSVSGIAEGPTRAATFYVPEVTRGAFSALPSARGSALRAQCRLGGIWYRANGRNAVAGVVKELSAAWGPAHYPARFESSKSLSIAGSGLWKDTATWTRGNVSVWVAWTDWNKGSGEGLRTVVWIARDRPPEFDMFSSGFDTTAAAAKIAGLDSPTTCGRMSTAAALARLSRLLAASRTLPAERRAAALLVANSFVACVIASGAKQSSIAALGAKFAPGCPQDGPVYAGTFREQAAALDPTGPAGALAALIVLQAPCASTGPGPWPENLIQQGTKDLARFPEGPWTAWMRFAIARAHDVKLSFSIPPGEADVEVVHTLTAAQAERERDAAIEGFTQFIKEQPNSSDAVFAWQEAWRLIAGLPPTPTHFSCSCE